MRHLRSTGSESSGRLPRRTRCADARAQGSLSTLLSSKASAKYFLPLVLTLASAHGALSHLGGVLATLSRIGIAAMAAQHLQPLGERLLLSSV
mmetsp:Transcript_10478/g.26184  ORF Transcript_10478/g.26184 Transcript_10478/m.26184 type:complete len:93 (-) Transcript_10478:3-281(-)